MSVKRLFNDRHYFADSSGNNAGAGYKLCFFLAGSTTPATTYNSSLGTVPNSNPMVLDAAGRLQAECWITAGIPLKVVYTTPGDTFPPAAPVWTEDNVSGINDFPSNIITGEWIASGFTPTYISANSFSVPGDQTAILQVGRRLQIVDSGGTKYATITASVFGAGITTVTVLVDNGGILQNPVSSVAYGLLSATNPSIPFFIVQNIYPISSAPNAFFQVDQLVNAATSVADDVYGHDHWYVLTQTASVQVSSQTLQENGQSTNARLNQNQAASQRMGYAAIVESKEAQKLRGQTMTFKPRIRCSSSQAIRVAVIEWTGTADAVVSDIVNDWTSSDYTDGPAKFFVDASQTPLGTSAVTPGAATWTDATSLQVTISSSCNNLILFVWTEAVAAQNVTLDIGKVCFVPGQFASNIYVPTFDETLRYAKRFFYKTFPYATAPAQNAGGPGAIYTPVVVAGVSAGSIVYTHLLDVPMRTVAPTVTFYNPLAANAFAFNDPKATSATATGTAAAYRGERSIPVTATGLAGWAIGDLVVVHMTADTRL